MDATVDNAGAEGARTLGQTLAAERERHGLSAADVAHRLHMSPSQVEALEHGDYERLPKGTFLRGFVRNYAKVLGLDSDPLLALLAEAKQGERPARVIVPTENIRFDPLGERFSGPYMRAAGLAVVAIVLAFAAMYWWLFIRPTPPGAVHRQSQAVAVAPRDEAARTPKDEGAPAPAADESAQGPEPNATGPSMAAPSAANPPASRASQPASPASAPTAKASPGAIASPAPVASNAAAATATSASGANAGEKALRFAFKGESWVEVRDAKGKVLFQQLNAAGTRSEVRGRPPFAVIVGNAPQVEVSEDDRAFPLDPYTKGDVARFTVQ